MAALTTAALYVSEYQTDPMLTGDPDERPPLLQRFSIIGDGVGWKADPIGYFRAEADRELTRRGHTRTGDWTYDAYREAHLATIASA